MTNGIDIQLLLEGRFVDFHSLGKAINIADFRNPRAAEIFFEISGFDLFLLGSGDIDAAIVKEFD